ncbi:Integrase catalytic core protein, partial [Globisporangium polare]
MGYEESSKAYRVYDIEGGDVVINRDVNFDEAVIGGTQLSDSASGVIDILNSLDDIEIEGSRPLSAFKYTGKWHAGTSQSANFPSADENDDEGATRRSPRQRISPVEWWRASANMVEATEMAKPATFQEAVSGPDHVHWRAATRAELESVRLRGVFRAAKLPTGQRAIGTKRVLKIKRDADISIEKYKARLVAKGFRQKYGIDYEESFAHVV